MYAKPRAALYTTKVAMKGTIFSLATAKPMKDPQGRQDGHQDAHRQGGVLRHPREDGRGGDSGQGGHGAHRQINAAGDDDIGHPRGQQAVDGDLDEDVEQIGLGEKVGHKNAGACDQNQQKEHKYIVLHKRYGMSGQNAVLFFQEYPPYLILAKEMIFSSLASCLFSMATASPARITRMRSETPRISGSSEETMTMLPPFSTKSSISA